MKSRFARAAALLSCGCLLFSAAWSSDSVAKKSVVESKQTTIKTEQKTSEDSEKAVTTVDYGSLFDGIDYAVVVQGKVNDVDSEMTDTSEYGYNNLGLADVDTYLNVRADSNTDSDIVGIMSDKSACEIEADLDGWAKVTSGQVSGYVCTDYIITGIEAKKMADKIVNSSVTVNTDLLCVRESSSEESEVISQAPNGTVLPIAETKAGDDNITVEEVVDAEVVDESTNESVPESDINTESQGDEEWIEVAVDEKTVGFVYAEYVTRGTELDTASPVGTENKETPFVYYSGSDASGDVIDAAGSTEKSAEPEEITDNGAVDTGANEGGTYTSADTGSAVADFALQFVGCPYVWGGTSLSGGSDCSGFVMSVYANFGVYLPHSSASQSGYGYEVSASEAQPGDLFFYGYGGVNHVGIYIGNGQIVHSSTPETGVRVSSAFYESPVCVRRLL